ncbi:hypothetical protein [Alteromonas sp. a30]|uniref:hypothetical protein n=1 Tax=Alteromonas sp. a30 TaxID=2730917 RepID=UPI00228125E0|nr:hypothetical protein [Alteromonas sp. a30]MCY7293877.1 hypothetical protein [Alteromonas sp. a30]
MEDNRYTIGGSLESALKGEFTFSAESVLKEGWEITKNGKSVLLLGVLLIFWITAGFSLFLYQFTEFGKNPEGETAFLNQFLMEASLTVLLAPFFAALEMTGISNSIRAISRPSFIFHFVPKTLILSVASLLVGFVVQIGFAFLILPGIYLLMASSFTIPLILDKGFTPVRALVTSISVVNRRLLEFMKVFGFFALLGVICAMTFGIALIWTLPFYYNVKGVLYRDIFGVQVKVLPNNNEKLKSDNIFHA